MSKAAEREALKDPVLGLLMPKDDGGWKASVQRGGYRVGIEIGGDPKPDPSLVLHAHDIVADFPRFARSIKRFLATEAANASPEIGSELKQLEIEYVCLFWPDRPDDGMIFFTGPNDEKRLWRCEYVDRSPKGLGYDR